LSVTVSRDRRRAELASEFSFDIDVSGHAVATVTNNDDGTKKTMADAKCSFSPPTRTGSASTAIGALAVLGLVLSRRRRRA
jgi:MYXO-CTERM domain-containing protein